MGQEKLGQDIGMLVKEIDASAADPDYHAGAVEALQENEEVLVNPAVADVVAEANNLAAHTVVDPDDICTRNWALPCPDGWSLVGDICAAPRSYAGPCKPTQALRDYTPLEKTKFVSNCKAVWPCADSCADGHDYEGCPNGWVNVGAGFCNSPEGKHESNHCGSIFKFDVMGIP